jgi:hypothetical protein
MRQPGEVAVAMKNPIRFKQFATSIAILALCLGVVAGSGRAIAADAAAQNSPTNGAGQIKLPLPGTNLPPGQQNLTADQMKAIMAYRYLQSRGGGGQVRRGVPQFVPFGYGNAGQDMQAQQAAGGADPAAAPTSERDAKKQEAKAKRVEALKAAAEKKKAAREARAQQRKAQQGQPATGDPK